MKPLLWDAINPFTGQPFTWDDKNIRWSDPSYYLEPHDEGFIPYGPETVKPKPKRAAKFSVSQLNLPPNMQPFRYLIYLIKGIFTAKPALRDAMPEGEYLDTLATRSGLTRAQVEGLITAQSALHVELARQGIPVDFILKRFRVMPTCGGSYTSPDPDDGEVCATLSYSLIVHPDEIAKMRVDCQLEKTGEAGELGPVVESVRSRPGNVLNKYGVGTAGGTEVNGTDFREKRADSEWPTAALVPVAGGAAIPLAVLDCTPTRLVLGGAPTGTTGEHYLKITDAGDHFTTYDQALTAA